jgi:hypothetical protein
MRSCIVIAMLVVVRVADAAPGDAPTMMTTMTETALASGEPAPEMSKVAPTLPAPTAGADGAVTAAARVAVAAPVTPASTNGETAEVAQPASVSRDDSRRSVVTAYALSMVSIAMPCGFAAFASESERRAVRDGSAILCTAALVLGPSVGHWYAGRSVTTGLVLRVAAAGGLAGLAVADPHLDHVATVFGIVGAVALFETGMLWDVATLPRAVRTYNREHAIAVAPLATPHGGGLALSAAF